MQITIELSPDTLRALDLTAQTRGVTTEQYAVEVLQKHLALSRLSFDELLSPLREAVQRSGLSDDEVDHLLGKAIETSRRQKKDS